MSKKGFNVAWARAEFPTGWNLRSMIDYDNAYALFLLRGVIFEKLDF
jgi:hypothetical protein